MKGVSNLTLILGTFCATAGLGALMKLALPSVWQGFMFVMIGGLE